MDAKILASDDFQQHLTHEIMQSQRIRYIAMAGVYFLIAILVFIGGSMQKIPAALLVENWGLANFYWIALLNIVVGTYELINFILLKRESLKTHYYRLSPYFTSFIEAVHPTCIIWLLSQSLSIQESLNAPAMFLYPIVIMLSSLHIKSRICVFTGATAGLSYMIMALFILEQPLMQSGIGIKTFYFIVMGVVAALVTNQVRKNLIKSRSLFLEKQKADAENHAKTMFLSSMSHELRTPLNAIIGYSEMLIEDAIDRGNKQLTTDLYAIEGAGKHLLGIISNVLDLAKIESGKIELNVENVSTSELLRQIKATANQLSTRNNNQLVIDAGNCPETLSIDGLRLEQILINLLGNSCKFTTDGEISLSIKANDDRILFSVKDTGIGMSQEQINKLFDEFKQASPAITKQYGGTGLGMAICKQLTELMNGKISVESEPGKGSTFVVDFPLSAQTA